MCCEHSVLHYLEVNIQSEAWSEILSMCCWVSHSAVQAERDSTSKEPKLLIVQRYYAMLVLPFISWMWSMGLNGCFFPAFLVSVEWCLVQLYALDSITVFFEMNDSMSKMNTHLWLSFRGCTMLRIWAVQRHLNETYVIDRNTRVPTVSNAPLSPGSVACFDFMQICHLLLWYISSFAKRGLVATLICF